MHKRLKVIAATLGVALLVGTVTVGAAFAADPPAQGTNYHEVLLGKVASILGIDQQKLADAFTQARGEMLDEAVAEGRITEERAKLMQERMEQAGTLGGPMGFKAERMHGGKRGAFGDSHPERPWGTPPRSTPAPTQ